LSIETIVLIAGGRVAVAESKRELKPRIPITDGLRADGWMLY